MSDLVLMRAGLAKLELLKRQAFNNFYVFCKYVLGKKLMEEVPHKELCDVMMAIVSDRFPAVVSEITTKWVLDELKAEGIEGVKRKALIMLPRGSFKSTIASQAFVLWLLWHDQNLRVMIDCETLSMAKAHLSAIKDMMTNSVILKKVATDSAGKYLLAPNMKITGGFTEDSVILACRTATGLKEPTVFVSGVDNAKTGMHPDIIIMDDIVSERNVTTQEQIDKTRQHYAFALSLLEPDGQLVVIGTRYHMSDLYGDLKHDKNYVVLIRPAITPEGDLYFPTRLTKQYLEAQRIAQGSYIFSSQYLLTPISGDASIIKEQWIAYYEILPKDIDVYILSDLAISQSNRADYTVVMAIGVTRDKDIYVIEYARGRFTPYETIEHMFTLYDKYKARLLGVEVTAYQKAMIYMLQDEMKRRQKYMVLKELKSDKDKIRRIEALVPYFENGKILIKSDMTELLDEALQFPYGKHDDTLDPLAYTLQVLDSLRIRRTPTDYTYRPNSTTGY